jgi:hypothetical protein
MPMWGLYPEGKVPGSNSRGGRPPKLAEEVLIEGMDGEVHAVRVGDEILRRIAAGMSAKVAAESVGISKGAFYEWVARGEGRHERPATPEYVDFAAAVSIARARGRGVLELYVRQHSKEDGRLALEALARRYPEEWGRRDRIYLRHAIKVEDLGLIADRVFDVICRHVAEPDVREAIATDLAAVLDEGAPLPTKRIEAHVVDDGGNGDPGRAE